MTEQYQFEIGQKVFCQLYNLNGIVKYRQMVETSNRSFCEYGVVFHKSSDFQELEIEAHWLNSGWDAK